MASREYDTSLHSLTFRDHRGKMAQHGNRKSMNVMCAKISWKNLDSRWPKNGYPNMLPTP
ncbi:c864ab09-5b2e-4e04-a1aa-4cb7b187d50c [Sclerotinia trifoliorum]|uniref:C864ab09-5b2e-4e04-a1aa-4cb7b187d50c n=1 Tax=Sclerotinia trifoliorum TaxID=28548 RepID=A0A8H2W022_9HELO|nr:c864ab09-5b2e-4e04-a1aa-4cb7b187d50c [Sclerotinia trifoliorum]